MSASIRAVVIAVVAALAVGIGVAAGGFLLAQRSAAVGGGAAYVPAEAPFFAELRLEPSAAQDGALREFLGHFPAIEGVDLSQPLYGQLGEWADEALAEEGAGVTWSGDVATWFDGRLAMALTDLPADMAVPADPMAVREVPPFVVLLGVTDRAAAAAAIDRLIDEAGADAPSFTESQHLGFTIRSADETEGAYALTDDQVVIAADADGVRAALDAHAEGSGTLDEVAEMQRLVAQLPADWLAFATYDFTELMAQASGAAASASPEMAAAVEAILEHQSLRGAMAFSAAGERLLFDVATDPPTGPLAPVNADRGLAAEVPSDALYYSEASNVGASLVAIIEPLKDAVAGMPGGEEQVAMLEAALGADLTELVSWIGDAAIMIGADGTSPYGGLLAVPTDVEAAQRRLNQLASFASLAASDPTSGITVDEAEVAGETVTTIGWEDPAAVDDPFVPAPSGIVVEFTVTEDRALIGIGTGFVETVLTQDPESSLASLGRYRDAVEQLGGADNAGVTWVDLRATIEVVEGAFGPMLAMAGDDTYETEVRPWLLPLDRIVGVTRLEGDVLLQRVALLVE
jgi:uncharacterized protein DUF3352